ncbi:hypothetical protein ACP4OV_021358 [Aristida adscensionis]
MGSTQGFADHGDGKEGGGGGRESRPRRSALGFNITYARLNEVLLSQEPYSPEAEHQPAGGCVGLPLTRTVPAWMLPRPSPRSLLAGSHVHRLPDARAALWHEPTDLLTLR